MATFKDDLITVLARIALALETIAKPPREPNHPPERTEEGTAVVTQGGALVYKETRKVDGALIVRQADRVSVFGPETWPTGPAFTDGNGRIGDKVMARSGRRGTVRDILQDGEAYVYWDGAATEAVKWINLAKIP